MSDIPIVFQSGSVEIAGTIRAPNGLQPGDRRPAFVVLHGFGTHMNAANVLRPCELLEELGYITLRFDMRGCGKSGGNRGRLNCAEQVEDTKAAVGVLSLHPQVLPDRIGVIGSSYGGAIAVAAAASDPRVAAVISASGWSNGERKFRQQHATPEAWARFDNMLREDLRLRSAGDPGLMVSRFDIVPIPPKLRGGLAGDAVMSFTADTAQSIFDFRPEDMVKDIAPRPLLLMHSSNDSVTPTTESIEMFRRAGHPTELHLFADTDHFMLAEGNPRVRTTIVDWLQRYSPR
jgi:dipeptidyl aminopeptidase/acylaminoacyl peptidase